MSEQETTDHNNLTEFMSTSDQHPGFHRIAYAIRHSTVIPQRQNANYKSGQRDEKPLYDVRYGLGNSLRRKTDSAKETDAAKEFMEALQDFLQSYNAETVQVFDNTSDERKKDPQNYARKHYRQGVLISDLDDVLVLVKKYGPRLVCSMLVSYGYATSGRKIDEGADASDRNQSQDINGNFEGIQ